MLQLFPFPLLSASDALLHCHTSLTQTTTRMDATHYATHMHSCMSS